MTRDEAIELGLKTYNGKPCKCGSTLKYVSGYCCVTCTSETTLNRDPEVTKRYARSEKGRASQKRIRNTHQNIELKRQWRINGGSRREYQRNKLTYTNNTLIRRYGISLDEYYEKLEQQNNCCYICGRNSKELSKNLCVDHNHETKQVRKLLCHTCNSALGHAKESIELLEKMIDYLKEHS